ncbi:MAG: MIP family channel protein [Clostridiales bacterium]|jgi:aquaporin Z|nr:MIP family channel protein [Clostridiales bacterium]
MKSFDLRKFNAEAFGTFVLVLFGCGVAVFSGVDLVATALAFGLVIVALAYVIGPISGCHINPAVSLGLAINKRITWFEFGYYVAAQVLGALVGAAILFLIQKTAGIGEVTALGQNGFDGNSAWTINVWGALVTEIILTFVFVLTVIAVTSKKSTSGKKAGVIIGLTLTLVHLLGIRLTGTSVNPARSFGPALLLLGESIEQVWVFIVAPFVGAALAAVFGKFVLKTEE